jgi:VWFA-related protein
MLVTAGCLGATLMVGRAEQAGTPQNAGAARSTDAKGGTAAPAPAGQAPTPVFRTGVNFVRVDVIVSSKDGSVVADLKEGDFEVLEDGKPQTIESFKLISLDGGVQEAAVEPPREIRTDYDEEKEAARDDVRLFGLFLDEYHVRTLASMSVRQPLTAFIEKQLGPSDMMGVMTPLEPITSVRMTRNHKALLSAIEHFRGRKGDYTPMNPIEEQYATRYPPETIERLRNQVSLSAIKSLIIHMGGLKEGRKALILVSEGYSNTLPPELRTQAATALSPPTSGGNLVSPFAEERYQFFQSQDLEFFLQGIYEVAAQNNVAIYAVDPRGLPVFEFDIDKPVSMQTDAAFLRSTQNTLRALALETDGRAILNRNDLETGMKQIMRDSSGYYLLGYTSSQAKLDGKFHTITVRVKRPGIQLRARKGYWALTPETTPPPPGAGPSVSSPPPAFEAALATARQPIGARVVRTWIGTSRGENGRTRVTFVWEPAAKPPGERASLEDAPSRVSVMAIGADGSPLFRGKVPDPASSSGTPGPGATTRSSRLSFDVKPGTMQLRISVEGSNAQILDTETRDITVPDLTTPQISVGTPELFRARTARDYQQMKNDPTAVPVAAREFSRTERLLVRVAAYGPTPPVMKARLLNRAGQPMNDLAVTPGAAVGDPAQFDVPLSGLASGEYLIEITAAAPEGGTSQDSESRQLVGIRVTS